MTCASKPCSWTGLTLATSPAGVCVLHSNQQLEQVNNYYTFQTKENEINPLPWDGQI
jgi:hypothetical protein